MPRKIRRVYLSDLPYEPAARVSSATSWTTRAPAPCDSDEIWKAVESLSQKERFVIARRFGMDGLPETLSAIGRLLGCTRERVRQVESQALNKLRDQLDRA